MTIFFLPLIALLCGCALKPAAVPAPAAPPPAQILRNAEIRGDAVWEGRIVIDGTVKVFKGSTLTVRPGTDISFVRRDDDGDGLGDSTLIVEGTLKAVGTRSAPIRFRSAASDPRPGDWLEIRVDFSRETRLRWCEITDSAYTLHAHFTRGVMEDCVIRRNIDGCRLGQAAFVIRNSLVEENEGKGINFRNSTVELTGNIIRRNGSGIFLFESDRPFSIHGNNLYQNRENFRLGDFFTADVALGENWWGTPDPAKAAETIFDRKSDPAIGSVSFRPAPEWLSGTGPRDALRLESAWSLETGAFVDASPAARDGVLFIPGWNGRLYALKGDGTVLWTAELGDVVDAAPALDGEAVYVQNWQREVFALDRRGGNELWRFSYPPSRADDHRQGGAVRAGGLLLVPGWNGILYALDPASGTLRWHYDAGEVLRAAVAVDGEILYLADGGGTLTALESDGGRRWSAKLPDSLLVPPAVTPEGPVALTRSGVLAAFDHSGAERWRLDLSEAVTYASPLYRDGAFYVATASGALWKIGGDGEVVWRTSLSGPLYAPPALRDGRLYLGDNSGRLNVLGSDSGDLLASFSVGGEIQGTPALVGNRAVFGSRDGKIHALDLKEGTFPPESPMPVDGSSSRQKPGEGR